MKKSILLVLLIISSTILRAQIPSYVPINGLVGWWPFNGNANDESGNGNNGTVNGAELTTDRSGLINKAYVFDGFNDRINASSNGFPDNNNPRSISLWFNIPVIPSPGTAFVLINYGVLNSNNSCGIGVLNNGLSFFSWLVQNDLQALTIINTNQWYHVVSTFDGVNSKIYLNGNMIASANQVKNTILNNLNIGYNSIDQFTNGKIDDIGIWNRALTQQEITRLYVGCTSSINIQPQNQSRKTGESVEFITRSSDTLATYQWQTDIGLGFQNISNAGQYTGANNDTLNINNLNSINNNQKFRCIILSNNACVDTSNVVTLLLDNSTFINKDINSNIKIYPNPTNDLVTIEGLSKNENTMVEIIDVQGKLVTSTQIIKQGNIDLSKLDHGVYIIKIGEMVHRILKM